MSGGGYFRPRSLAEVWRLEHEHAEALLVAGGTDLLVGGALARLERSHALISLRRVAELKGIETKERTWIGAATPVAELTSLDAFPVVAQAARRLGSVQIRNAATLGGNLCRAAPCADLAPPLLVLEARAELRSPTGSREVTLEEFFLGPGETCLEPGELLAGVWLDPPRPLARGLFLKKGRVKMDLALASVAVLLETEAKAVRRVRIAAGSVAPAPIRLRAVEALLEGKGLDPDLMAEAGDLAARSVAPISDIRATEAYRRRIVGVYLRRALQELG